MTKINFKIKRILKKILHHRHVNQKTVFLQNLYQNINSTKISLEERARLHLDDDTYTYGEIKFHSFYNLVSLVKPTSQEIFYDLGSGSGKTLLAAASYFDFSKIVGIELLPGLSKLSQQMIAKAQTQLALKKNFFHKAYTLKLSNIIQLNANFLDVDFSEANIIFINATCLHVYTWEKMIVKFIQLKPGSRIIVSSKKIKHPAFQCLFQTQAQMSWGISFIHIYQKI